MAKKKSKTKRRTQKKRSKGSRRSKNRGAYHQVDNWFHEALAIGLFAFSVFLLVSLLSARLNPTGKNLMGPVGELLGSGLSVLMGWCALVPVVGFATVGLSYWLHEHFDTDTHPRPVLSLVGLLVFLVASCGFVSVFYGPDGGGYVGSLLASPITQYFGLWGSALLLFACMFFTIALATQTSVGSIVAGLATVSFQLVQFLCIRVPLVVFDYLSAFSLAAYDYMVEWYYSFADWWAEWRAVEEDDYEYEYEEEVASKHNKQPKRAPEEVLAVLDDSEIVVKRRARAAERKSISPKVSGPYKLPNLSLLKRGETAVGQADDKAYLEMSRLIEGKLRDFNVNGRITQVHPGPVITLFEFEPAPGVKVNKINSLSDDLAMSLRAVSVRVIAPIPGRGTVGIEVPNKHRDVVRLRDILESPEFVDSESCLTVALGKDTYGEPVVGQVDSMPHLLMAGATGTGKSVSINALLLSFLYRATPEELGLILIDPKILELSVYEGIPHLKVPVVTVPRQAKAVLEWAVTEMDRRYRLMKRHGVRSIDNYNSIVAGEYDEEEAELSEEVIELSDEEVIAEGTAEVREREGVDAIVEELEPLPKIVIVIDELADLMMTVGRDIEDLIARLAQKARAAGIHLIVATQRPSVDVITGLIKANFPARLSFRVSSKVDSRTILDRMGADKLLGKGDMLFMPPGTAHLQRVHGAFVSDQEVNKVIESIKKSAEPNYDPDIIEMCERALAEEAAASSGGEGGDLDYDPLYDKVVEFVLEKREASTSMIQRVFRIGYNRAARIVDTMEQEGIVGPSDGSKRREVLVQQTLEAAAE